VSEDATCEDRERHQEAARVKRGLTRERLYAREGYPFSFLDPWPRSGGGEERCRATAGTQGQGRKDPCDLAVHGEQLL